MEFTINGISFNYPVSMTEITLAEWLGFIDMYGRQFDIEAKELEAMPSGYRKELDMARWGVNRAYAIFSYFTGISIEQSRLFTVNDVVGLYNNHFNTLLTAAGTPGTEYTFNDSKWILPVPVLSAKSPITFGEFIDSKALSKNAADEEMNRWQLAQYICAIFFRKEGEAYAYDMADEDSERFALVGSLPMNIVVDVMQFYEELNQDCEKFEVFAESTSKDSGPFSRKHFEQWGWVNFLKSIAKTKVFDIPMGGMNSIDCARAAKAYEVLVYASEDKSYNEAVMADMEYNRNKK